MEEDDEIQAQACKFPRVGNGRNEPNKLGSARGNEPEDGELRKRVVGGGGGGGGSDGSTDRFHTSTWHQSSRIVRVSRASGGKDRHSKVMTSKGLRDRRVRLSVTTAIQFYDLQDRLGYDQPSKAVEWLIKASSDAISELPSLNYTSFPDTPKQPSDEKRPGTLGTDHQQGFVDEVDGDTNNNNYHYQNQNQNQNQSQSQNFSLSKSACSSTSETSKGSGLSLSRSEIRVKARERARERAAKEKEKEKENDESHIAHQHQHHHHNVNPMSQTASFTELLTAGIGSTAVSVPTTTTTSPNGSVHQIHGGDEPNLFNKATSTTTRQSQQWSSTVTPMVMDYFSSGLVMGPSSSRTHQTSSGFSGQIQLGNNSLQVSPFSTENHSDQLQHFSFIPDHMIPAVVTSSQPSGISDCNLNFTISPGLAGYNRGTLQSNSPSHILPHHLQRFSSPIDGSNNLPFFIGGGAAHPASAAPTMDTNHHQLHFSPAFDGRLQLCYGDGTRHSDQKGKAKN